MLCSRCPNETTGHRYCRTCRTAYNREWRKTHPLSKIQQQKALVRTVAHLYAKRNGIKFTTCADCPAPVGKIEMHHPDYGRPHFVVPLCGPCHRKRHRIGKASDPTGAQEMMPKRIPPLLKRKLLQLQHP